MGTNIIEKRDFNIVLISLFGLDFGVYAISSFMESKGYTTYIVNFNRLKIPLEFMVNDYFTMDILRHDLFPKNDLQLLLELLTNLKPNLIGISVSSVTFQTTKWLTREIKKHFDIPIVWGGIHAITCPEDCIEEVDIVCIGEGECTLYEIAEMLRSGQPLNGIKNTWIRLKNQIQKNPMSELIKDLDSLPYADRIHGENKYFIDRGVIVNNPTISAGYMVMGYPMMTSRGCMYACSFCCHSVIRKKYEGLGHYLRRRSVNHVIGELKNAIQHRTIYAVRFWDDIFTYDESWIDEFCSRYNHEIGKPFICYGHPKHTKYEVLEKLSRIGLHMIYIGLQSGSEDINRNLFMRNQRNNEIMKFSKYAQRLRITLNFDVIVDNYYETEKDNYDTSELLMNLSKPYKALIFSLCFFPKTPLTNRALEDKVIRECDLEQNTSKAINNFFLFIQKSKDKYQMFWNCIKAMTVNPHFPKSIIRFCRNNKFFKNSPYFLFWLCRLWLRLFKPLGKKKHTDWLMPVLVEHSFIDDAIIWIGNKYLYKKDSSRYVLFPTGNSSLCLRINNNVNNNGKNSLKNSIRGLQVELTYLKEPNVSKKNIWRLRHKMILEEFKEIIFTLEFPDYYCCIDNICIKMTAVKIRNSPSNEEAPFLFRVKKIVKGDYIPFKFNKFLIAQSLCSVRAK